MTCSRMSGVTMMRIERPKRLRGSTRFSGLCRTRSREASPAEASRGASAAETSPAGARPPSIGLEDIPRPSHGLKVARETRILLDLAAQPRHLHVDGAQIPAELPLLRQALARDRRAGAGDEAGEQRRLGGGKMHRLLAAEELAPVAIEAEGAEADLAIGVGGGRRHAL